MEFRLCDLLRNALKDFSITRKDLVLRMGYRNTSKGLRRLDSWLQRLSLPNSVDQVSRLAKALEMDEEDVISAIDNDRELLQQMKNMERAKNPNYRVTVRLMPAFYVTHDLQGSLPIDEALKEAHKLAKGRFQFALNNAKNETYWCDANGHVTSVSNGREPYMKIGGYSFRLVPGEEGKLKPVSNKHEEK